MDNITAADIATPEFAIIHDPPSLPASPPGKRTKYIEPEPWAEPIAPPPELPAPHQPLQPLEALSEAAPASLGQAIAMANNVPLKVKLLSEKGRAPERGSVGAAGYDVYRYSG